MNVLSTGLDILFGSVENALTVFLILIVLFARRKLFKCFNDIIKKHNDNKSVEGRKKIMLFALEKAERQVQKSRREFDKLDPELYHPVDYQLDYENYYERIKEDLHGLIYSIKESKKEKIKL